VGQGCAQRSGGVYIVSLTECLKFRAALAAAPLSSAAVTTFSMAAPELTIDGSTTCGDLTER